QSATGSVFQRRQHRPRSSHLNGKVERVQRTALEEFWPTVDLKDPELEARSAEWQNVDNWVRPHGSLGGIAPTGKDIAASYDPNAEPILPRNHWSARR
ncbi:integrase core domain-containing protein, partial [Acuticoccus mangrovi]|nr:transposase [Acuticoccus mangrovi]